MNVLPNNTASPMAWLAWGLSYSASVVQMSYSFLRHLRKIIVCPRIGGIVMHSTHSFTKKLRDDNKNQVISNNFSVVSSKYRRQIVRGYSKSFDLFDFGFILVSIACSLRGKLSEECSSRVHDLARRLISYGDADFIGDARDAMDAFGKKGSKNKSEKNKSEKNKSEKNTRKKA